MNDVNQVLYTAHRPTTIADRMSRGKRVSSTKTLSVFAYPAANPPAAQPPLWHARARVSLDEEECEETAASPKLLSLNQSYAPKERDA